MVDTGLFQDGKVVIPKYRFESWLSAILIAYRFYNKNENPKSIVVPRVTKVEGVAVEYEGQPEAKTKRTAK